MSSTSNISPWFKLFALSIVGGVAKSLFSEPRPLPPVINQSINKAADATVSRINAKQESDD